MTDETIVIRIITDTTKFLTGVDYATARLVGYVSGFAAQIARQGVLLANAFEKNVVAVQTMVKDLQVGTTLINDIVNLAVETPFSSEQLLDVTRQLKSFGFATADVIPTIKVLGEVSAGTGTDLGRIVLAFGQVRVAGKLMGTELRQFVDAGVPLIEYLAKVMNKPTEAIRQLTEQGQIGFSEVVQAFNLMTSDGGQFAGLMERQSKTTQGMLQALRETGEVAARNFADAAMKGLGVQSSLRGVLNTLKDLNKEQSQPGTVTFFENVKIAIDAVRAVFIQVLDPIQKAYMYVRQWVSENKESLRYVLLLVGGIWGLYAAVKAVTYALILVRTILITLAAVSGILSLISAVATLKTVIVGMVTAFSGIMAVVGPIFLMVSAIGLSLAALGAFRFSGDGFKEFGKAFGVVQEAFQTVVSYLQSGELDKAFRTLTVGIRYLFRAMLLTLKAEWSAFVDGLGLGLTELRTGSSTFMNRQWISFRSWQVGLNPFKSQEQVDKERKALWDYYETDVKKQAKDLINETARVTQAQKGFADNLFSTDETLLQLGEELRGLGSAAATLKQQMSLDKFVTGNLPTLEKVQAEMREVLSKIPKADMVLLGRDMDRIRNQAFMRNDEFLFPIQGMKRLAKEGNAALIEIGQDVDDIVGAQGIMSRLSDGARKFIKDMNAAYGKNPNGPDILIPNPFLTQASTGMMFAQMATPFGVSARARDVFNEIAKEFEKGVTVWEGEVKRMKAVNEAFYGSAKGNQIAAAAGGFGLAGGMKGIMSTAMMAFEDVQRFTRLQKQLGGSEYKQPTTAAFGTQQAQDIINANVMQRVSIEQEILAVMQAARQESIEQTRIQKEIAESTARLRQKGVLRVLGLEE